MCCVSERRRRSRLAQRAFQSPSSCFGCRDSRLSETLQIFEQRCLLSFGEVGEHGLVTAIAATWLARVEQARSGPRAVIARVAHDAIASDLAGDADAREIDAMATDIKACWTLIGMHQMPQRWHRSV